ncbi:MAG: glycosyltransferase, partial [bacterium]|nr:glycosyltransferase [bacterium]
MISIVIITYNNRQYLDKLLTKLSSIPKSWQVIIVDNNSDQKTKDILKKFQPQTNFNIIFNKKNRGFAKAVNQAAKAAKGKYLLLLNPDLLITPSQIQFLLEFAKKQQKLGAVVPALVTTGNKIQPSIYPLPSVWGAIKEFVFGLKQSYLPFVPKTKKPIKVPAAVGACMLIPKSAWQKAKGLSLKYFLYFEDVDFCRKLNRLGLPIWYLPNIKVKHIIGESSHQQTNRLLHQSASIYFGKTKKQIIDLIIRFGNFIPAGLASLGLAWLKLKITMNTSGFAADQEYLAWQAYKAWQSHNFFFTGMPASIGGFFIAPYYSYLNAIIFKLLNFKPLSLFATSFASNFITLIAIYYLAKTIFKKPLPAYLLMMAFAVSKYSNGLWPVDWLTLSAVLFLTSLWFIFQNQHNKALAWLSLSFFIGVSAHPSYLAIIPFVLIMASYLLVKSSLRYRLISVGLVIASLLPLILFDLKHNGHNLRGLLSIVTDQQNRGDYLQATPTQFIWVSLKNNYFKGLDIPISAGFVIAIIGLLSLAYLIRKHKARYYLAATFLSLVLLIGLPLVLTKTVDYYLLYPGIMLFFITWILILKSISFLPALIKHSTFIIIFVFFSYLSFS